METQSFSVVFLFFALVMPTKGIKNNIIDTQKKGP